MIAFAFLFICSGFRVTLGASFCPLLNPPAHGTVTCRLKNALVNCLKPSSGVVATFECREFYKLHGDRVIKCSSTGDWTSPAPTCLSDCGRKNSMAGLIVNGVAATPAAFPWHVAIYYLVEERNEYWCGGSLIDDRVIITAAHCVWQISPDDLTIVLGKTYSDFRREEKSVQKVKAKKVEMLSSYQDVGGNYVGDIAVIFTEKAVALGRACAPVCLDWDQRLTEKHLVEGNAGVVVGWGLTENDTVSDRLRMTYLPVVSDERCIRDAEDDFKKFVTYTSFCAGFGNGTGVCNGDSGGGLVFFDHDTGRWYLQGVVSVSPRRKGTPFCDPNYYAVFTKVAMFSNWVRRAMNAHAANLTAKTIHVIHKSKKLNSTDKDLYSHVRKYFGENAYGANGIKTSFPHTKGMLRWFNS